MATTNFDKNFDLLKSGFKQKFGKEWKDDPALYLQYMQAQYMNTITELLNTGLGSINAEQGRTTQAVQSVRNEIEKRLKLINQP